jgi:hypothetical protein
MNKKFLYIFLIVLISLIGIISFIPGDNVKAQEDTCTGADRCCCNPDENFCWKGTMTITEDCPRCCVGSFAECIKPPTKKCVEISDRTCACYPSLVKCVDMESVAATDCIGSYPHCCVPGAWCGESTGGMKTCEEKGWHCCAFDEYCTGSIQTTGFCDCGIYPPGASRCCSKICSSSNTCGKMGGDCCQDLEECSRGTMKKASDCNNCCVEGTCVNPSSLTCEEAGGNCCSNYSYECKGGHFIWAFDCYDKCCVGGTCVKDDGSGASPGTGVGTGVHLDSVICPPGAICIENPLTVESFEELINNIINFIFYFALAFAPLMFIIAGFYFITAAGEPEKIKTAQTIIWYTVIGLAIVILAKGIIVVIKNIFGA